MGSYLAILNGGAEDTRKADLAPEQQQAFLVAWGQWASANQGALKDPGAPLFRKRRVTASGVDDLEDSKVAYAIVEADSHDAAVEIFQSHPHLALAPGNSIDVIECPPPPT